MFKRENLAKVKIPALVLLIVSFFAPLFIQLQSYSQQYGSLSSAMIIGAVVQWLTYSLVFHIFAYLASYFLVIRRDKPDSHIWFCYVVCILVSAGTLFS